MSKGPLADNGSSDTTVEASSSTFSALMASSPGSAGPNVGTTQALTGNSLADGVLSGFKWQNLSLTYSFPSSSSMYEGSIAQAQNGFEAAQVGLQTAVAWALNHLSQFTGMTVSLAADPASADIRTGISSSPPTAEAYYPGNYTEAGDMWYGTAYPGYQNPQFSTYEWATVIHELGHALGLKHGHEADGAFPTLPTQAYDQMAYSIMTYRSYVNAPLNGYTNEQYGYATTFMMADILALQYMYGANYNTNSGDTVYRWNQNTGQMSINGSTAGQLTPGANRIFMTLWDGNGNDTYDFSNYTSALNIDLNPGAYSLTSEVQLANLGSGNMAPGNIFNAMLFNGDIRSMIENAFGGSGSDTIIGNSAANVLMGNGGADVFRGNNGNDQIYGGGGIDTSAYNGARANYLLQTYNSFGSIVTKITDAVAAEGSDLMIEVETLTFGSSSITLNGAQQNRVSNVNGSRFDSIIFHNNNNGQTYANIMVNGTLSVSGAISGANGGVWDAIDVADFNQDGRGDVLYRNDTSGIFAIGLTSGTGAISSYSYITNSLSSVYRLVGAADIDGDALTDVVIQHNTNGAVFVGDLTALTFNSWTLASLQGTGWQVRALGDVNRDGRADIVYQHSSGAVSAGLTNTSNGIASFLSLTGSGTSGWTVKDAADVNGDGFADVIIQNNTNGNVSYINMANGNATSYGTILTGYGNAWDVRGIADTNNDGDWDVVIQHNSNGTTYVVNMQNGNFQSLSLVAQGIGSSWYVV